ncbi:MAG: sulfotransferase family protein [Bacteroidia bacterium]
MTQQNIDKINVTPLNFVIGKERSGTTLLQVMLNAHSNIVAPPESRFIMLLYLKYGSKTNWKEKDVKAFCDDLFEEDFFRKFWKIDKDKLYASLIGAKEKLTYPLLCKLVFFNYAPPAKDVKMLIDKNPLYYYFLPETGRIFPGARYIHIVRDYRANIISHKRISWILNLNTYDMAYRWLKVNELIEEAKSKAPEQWITLKYEALVTDTEKVMKQVCSFLNIPYEEEMIKSHNTKIFQSFNQYHEEKGGMKFQENLFRPISTSFIDEWKEKMTGDDLAIAESIAGQFAEKTYGYRLYSKKENFHIGHLRLVITRWKYVIIMKYFRVLRHRWAIFLHKHIAMWLILIFYKEK